MSRSTESYSLDTGNDTAIAWNPTTFGGCAEVVYLSVKLDASPTTNEEMQVILVSNVGSDYDCIIEAWDPSLESTTTEKQNHFFKINQRFTTGDSIKLVYANTDEVNVYPVMVVDHNPSQ